jgi:DNA-binding NtrC family response regulator
MKWTQIMMGRMPQNEPAVMIVEDERVSRMALASLLNGYGYSTRAFESAEDLLAEVEQGEVHPRVVLADVDLPGMSGLDLLAQLERRIPGLYAVVITAADGDNVERFCREHPFPLLPKPLNLGRLLSLLEPAELQ